MTNTLPVLVILALLLIAAAAGLGVATWLLPRERDEDEDLEDTVWFDPREWIFLNRLLAPKPLRLTHRSRDDRA